MMGSQFTTKPVNPNEIMSGSSLLVITCLVLRCIADLEYILSKNNYWPEHFETGLFLRQVNT